MAELRVDVVSNHSGFIRGMNECNTAQRKFAGDWESRVGSIFRRSPFARAEHALSEFAVQLSSGNVTGAVAALGSRITGLGLAAGVGIGAGVVLFEKMAQEIEKASKAAEKLRVDVATAATGASTPEGASNKFQSILKDVETFTELTRQGFGGFVNRTANFFSNIIGGTRDIDNLYIVLRSLEQAGNALQDQVTSRQKLEILADLENKGLKEQAGVEKELLNAAIERSKVEETAIERRLDLQKRIASEKDPNVQGALQALIQQTRIAEAEEKASIDRVTQYRIQAIRRAGVARQRGFFDESVKGFTPQTAATTEQFLRDKIAADPFARNVREMQLKADQLNLFRNMADLNQMNDIEQRTIPGGSVGARVFQQNLQDRIDAQQRAVAEQTQRVFGEQKPFMDTEAVVSELRNLNIKIDNYWGK